MSAKGCRTCPHLEWHDDDSAAPGMGDSGFGCNKRDDGGANGVLLKNLARDKYLNQYKRCWEPKPTAERTTA